MYDSAYIVIGDKKIEGFLSYRIESDIFEAADAFEIRLAPPGFAISGGSRIEVFINGEKELTGIIDKPEESSSKNSHEFVLTGRDLMGIVVNTHLETFETKKDIKLEDLAIDLLKDIPFVDIKKVIFGKGDKNRIVPLSGSKKEALFNDSKADFVQTEPGDTVFSVLSMYAQSRGMIFFSMPDGTFVFGRPLTSGRPAATLIRKKKNPEMNNIIEGTRSEDISKSYSSVTVIGQKQGTNLLSNVGDTDIKETVENPGFPFKKPYVTKIDGDITDPKNHARLILEKQRFESFSLEYTVYGHSQGGRNYQTNSICHVEDEGFSVPVVGDYLIYSRTFERSRTGGTTTQLKLSELGVFP